jgi:hypothetical protein
MQQARPWMHGSALMLVHTCRLGDKESGQQQQQQQQPFRLVMGQGPDGRPIPLGVISTTPHVSNWPALAPRCPSCDIVHFCGAK